jgi:pimeloyl-ACP methyl ester carboxylesterase
MIVLPDGRRLGYAEYGDPDGVPVMSFHGGLSSRLDAAPADEACRTLGIRLVSPDRPGMGLSDFQEGRTLLDWPADVVSLADGLGIGRFGAVGWSAGGPYVAACGFAIAERLTAGAMVASAVPFELSSRRGLNLADRVLLFLSERMPWAASQALRLSVGLPSPTRLERSIAHSLVAADMEAIRRAGPPDRSLAFMKEALRDGTRGVIADYRVFGDPWGFALEDVAVPIHVWQGSEDTLCPPGDPALLAEHLPDAELTIVPGEGHLSLLRNQARAILEPFVAVAC